MTGGHCPAAQWTVEEHTDSPEKDPNPKYGFCWMHVAFTPLQSQKCRNGAFVNQRPAESNETYHGASSHPRPRKTMWPKPGQSDAHAVDPSSGAENPRIIRFTFSQKALNIWTDMTNNCYTSSTAQGKVHNHCVPHFLTCKVRITFKGRWKNDMGVHIWRDSPGDWQS